MTKIKNTVESKTVSPQMYKIKSYFNPKYKAGITCSNRASFGSVYKTLVCSSIKSTSEQHKRSVMPMYFSWSSDCESMFYP